MFNNSLTDSRQEFLTALFEFVAEISPIPVGLYQYKDGGTIALIPESSRAKYVEHCKLIQNFKGGKQKCQEDQLARAEAALNSDKDIIKECCWAGVHNESKPIKIDGKPKALLVYGGGQLEKSENNNESNKRHKKAVEELNLSEEEAAKLKMELDNITPCLIEDFAKVQKVFTKATSLISLLEEKQSERKYIAERSLHEIVTRLQAVIAEADNLILQINDGDIEIAKKTALSISSSAQSLDTVAQNLGNSLEAYQFRRHSLKNLIDQSIQHYLPEATRRGVQINSHLQHPSDIEVSKNHLQYALNNLIHNAIKYSFRGGYDQKRLKYRNRFVVIEGHSERGFYKLSISNYGVGVLSDEYEKIFEDGYKGQLTENEYRTGSGKGLSFVKRIIDEHNGKIEVESILISEKSSDENKPYLTKFTIRLPYYQPK